MIYVKVFCSALLCINSALASKLNFEPAGNMTETEIQKKERSSLNLKLPKGIDEDCLKKQAKIPNKKNILGFEGSCNISGLEP